jgi:hypothetical protein
MLRCRDRENYEHSRKEHEEEKWASPVLRVQLSRVDRRANAERQCDPQEQADDDNPELLTPSTRPMEEHNIAMTMDVLGPFTLDDAEPHPIIVVRSCGAVLSQRRETKTRQAALGALKN